MTDGTPPTTSRSICATCFPSGEEATDTTVLSESRKTAGPMPQIGKVTKQAAVTKPKTDQTTDFERAMVIRIATRETSAMGSLAEGQLPIPDHQFPPQK